MFSVLLSTEPAGPELGTGGAGFDGGPEPGNFGALSTDALLLSFAFCAGPFGSWWLFSSASGRVAERLARASFSVVGGAGGADIGGPVALTPLTVSDLKNSSRLLCNWK